LKKPFILLSLVLVLSLIPIPQAQKTKAWQYMEYPTETWIIEKQDYFGSWLEWNFIPVDGQHGDKRVWNFTWRHLPYFDAYAIMDDFIENPIFEIRLAYDNETWLKQIYDKTEPLQFRTWGDFQSDVSRLAKYPIVPEDKEEFTGLHTDINILNFDNGSFLVSFKDKWKMGKKITIGFASTITYSGATNTITCIGGTEGSPIDFWDLWNASDVNGWDVVNNTCNTQFKFWCKIQVGDGSTITWFADIDKQVTFNTGILTGNYQFFIAIKNKATFRIGQLDNAPTYSTSRGCYLHSLETTYIPLMISDQSATSIIKLYCSLIDGVGTKRVYLGWSSGTWTIWNCTGP